MVTHKHTDFNSIIYRLFLKLLLLMLFFRYRICLFIPLRSVGSGTEKNINTEYTQTFFLYTAISFNVV